MWVHAVTWTLLGLVMLVVSVREGSPSGLERLRRMEPDKARAVQDRYRSSVIPWVVALLGLVAAGNAVVLWVEDEPAALAYGVEGLVLVSLVLAHRRARPRVLAVLKPRQLPAPFPQEKSERRRRRITQFGTAAAGFFVLSGLLFAVGEQQGHAWLGAVAAVLLVVSLVAAVGLAWAAAWRYGDEAPVE